MKLHELVLLSLMPQLIMVCCCWWSFFFVANEMNKPTFVASTEKLKTAFFLVFRLFFFSFPFFCWILLPGDFQKQFLLRMKMAFVVYHNFFLLFVSLVVVSLFCNEKNAIGISGFDIFVS